MSSDLADTLKKCPSAKFKIEDKCSMRWFLGVPVEHTPGEITFSQKSYILDLLCCFGMSACNPWDLPTIANTRIDKILCFDLESDAFKDLSENGSLYMYLVKKLNYFAVVSHRDLSFTASSLSRKLSNSSHDHCFLTQKILCYWKGTFDIGLVFKPTECLEIVAFCDSDLGWDPNDGHSTICYCFEITDHSSVFVGLPLNIKQ